MTDIRLKSSELETFVHVTEDESKVIKALHNIVSEPIFKQASVKFEKLMGYFHNPIKVIRVKLSGNKLVSSFLSYLSSKLSETEKKQLNLELPLRIDKDGTLYLRIDKQSAFLDEIKIRQVSDSVKIIVKIRKSHETSPEQVIDFYKNYLVD
ncbi:MAG: RNA-binding domain-containing protein [Candidatus Odinarchaeia archaeon]